MTAAELRFYDTTLRDGLRNSGVSMTIDERIAVALSLETAGVQAIEIGFGGPEQPAIMQSIAEALTVPVVYGLSRVNLKDVDRVLDGVAPAPRSGINIYLPCSDQFLTSSGLTRDRGLGKLTRAIQHARQHVDHVVFATQDATRSDRSFLTEVCAAAIESGATTISISDTVSHALPSEFADLCAALRQGSKADEVLWSVHCHNELGLAVANSIAAVAAGANQVEGTINGIGEGAGNTSLQTVAKAVTARPEAFAEMIVSVDIQLLNETATLVSDLIAQQRYP